MSDEIVGTSATSIIWDEIAEAMERSEDNAFTFSTSATTTVTLPNANGNAYRVDGIDWGNSATSVAVFGASTQWDAGYVYAPYIPLMGATTGGLEPQRTEYFTFQPRMSTPYINLEYTFTGTGDWKVYVQPEDHFIDHEDLFEI